MREHKTNIALGIVFGFCALSSLFVPPVAAQDEIPAEVLELLDATGEDGAPVLSQDQRNFFDALPKHAKGLLADAVDLEFISNAEQVRLLLSVGLTAQEMELLLQDNCILCHTNPDYQDEATLFTTGPEAFGEHLDLQELVSDVHFRRGLSCSGCHGGTPDDEDMADEIYERWPDRDERAANRRWVPEFCGRCHSDPGFMRRFNPSLATDQVAKYVTSRHGVRLLQEGDSLAAECTSCHGNHGIRRASSRKATTHPTNVPATCGRCHSDPEHMAGYKTRDGEPLPTNQLEQYRKSVHGIALLENDDLGAPACNDCHGNHAAMPPEVASVSQICRTCHAANGRLFDGSAHRQAFATNGWPECGKCHGKHDVVKLTDDMLRNEAGGMCYDCHAVYSTQNPECQATATYFHGTITHLAESRHELEEQVEVLAAKGLDVDGLTENLSSLEDALRSSRSRIHSFDRSDFDQAAQPGIETVHVAESIIAGAEREHRSRQRGLGIAIGFVGLVALALVLRLRMIESA
jgi:predicted CXXCH cytochrome family protein